MNSDTYEALHPELAQYLEPMAGFGQMLRHPLVYSVPYFGEMENARLNKCLEVRREMLAKAMAEERHHSWVFLHERPYRLDALLEIRGTIPDKDFLPIVLEVYTDSENARCNFHAWEDLLEPLTGTDPWKSLADLPDTMVVYRGGVKEGFSWTRNLEVAKYFSTRLGGNGDIWTATVAKSDIVGYYDGRNEDEVIASYESVSHLIDQY
jgi:hypothetical protein